MNVGLRLNHIDEYARIDQQHGKLDAKLSTATTTTDLDEAIRLVRSGRGHLAVILKELHGIQRERRLYMRQQMPDDNGQAENAAFRHKERD